MRRPTLLVLRALGLGDFLTSLPALRAIRRARPDHDLVLAAPEALAELAALSGAIDRLHPTPSLEALAYEGPVDVAVNLHGRGPQSHRALLRCNARELVAFATDDLDGPRWRDDEHEVHRWCRLVAKAFAVPTDPGDLRLEHPDVPSGRPGSVVVHPGAAYEARRWPAERFAAVARTLAGAGRNVVITGSVGERSLADEVARLAGLGEDAVVAGRTGLLELAALVGDACLVVSGDTGLAHLASAYATPSVVLFGPTPPQRWGPPEGPHVALWHGTRVGDPWADDVDPALLRITVDEVLAHAEHLLASDDRTIDRLA